MASDTGLSDNEEYNQSPAGATPGNGNDSGDMKDTLEEEEELGDDDDLFGDGGDDDEDEEQP